MRKRRMSAILMASAMMIGSMSPMGVMAAATKVEPSVTPGVQTDNGEASTSLYLQVDDSQISITAPLAINYAMNTVAPLM